MSTRPAAAASTRFASWIGLVASSGLLFAFSTACTGGANPPDAPGAPEVAVYAVTYSRDVAPLLEEHCQSCHQNGGIAPLSLTTWADAAAAAPAIKNAVQSRRMPQGPSVRLDTGCSSASTFLGPRRLLQQEIDTIVAWVDDGAPEGDPSEQAPPVAFESARRNDHEPDLVFANDDQGFLLPPNLDRDVFRRFVIEPNFDADRFLTGFDALPGVSGGNGLSHVVHHVTLFIDGQGKAPEQLQQFQASAHQIPGPGFEGDFTYPTGLIGMWFPGSGPFNLGAGKGIRIPRGACIVMEIHYGRVSTPVVDRTSVGLHLSNSVTEEIQTSLVKNENIFIPAGSKDIKVRATRTFTSDFTLYAVTPHMHQIGTDFRVSIGMPGGEVCLADVEWNFEHQGTYRLKVPMKIPAGATIRTECGYDNSAGNQHQPNSPPQDIAFGRSTDKEMCQLTISTSALSAP